jgi:hypothetical protein
MPSQHRLVKHEGEDGKEAGGWLGGTFKDVLEELLAELI